MGSDSNLYMGGSSILAAGSSILTANNQSQSIKMQGEFQKNQYEFNSRLAEDQAKDAIARGYAEAGAYRKNVKKIAGSQKTSLAAQGIEIDSGSALDVQQDTQRIGKLDAITIKNNAFREAWGYKVQAIDAYSKGQYTSNAASYSAKTTLITGGLTAASQFSQGAGYFGKYISDKGNT